MVVGAFRHILRELECRMLIPPKPTARKPLIDTRFRSVLFSIGVCLALIMAYYMAVGQAHIPPDTEIVYQGCAGTPCHAFRLQVDHDGAVSLMTDSGSYRYRISAFALRRTLRVFNRQRFLDRDVMSYSANGGAACELSLRLDHRLTALTHACSTQAPEIARPVEALEQATRFREVAAGDAEVRRDLGIQPVT